MSDVRRKKKIRPVPLCFVHVRNTMRMIVSDCGRCRWFMLPARSFVLLRFLYVGYTEGIASNNFDENEVEEKEKTTTTTTTTTTTAREKVEEKKKKKKKRERKTRGRRTRRKKAQQSRAMKNASSNMVLKDAFRSRIRMRP
jgi:hydroxylamine reductase (hybrid-cluster protein)